MSFEDILELHHIITAHLLDRTRSGKIRRNPVYIENQYHEVLYTAIAAIHPFSDGNGRTARAITSLFLALSRYDCGGSLVLDSYYASDRRAYYAILQLVNGKNYATSIKSDLTPWLEYFTDGFLTSLHVLDAEVRILNSVLLGGRDAISLDPEDQDILSYASKFGSISISEAEAFIPEVSRRSVQRRFRKLVDEGYLTMVGEARDARYTINAKPPRI